MNRDETLEEGSCPLVNLGTYLRLKILMYGSSGGFVGLLLIVGK